MDALLDDYNDSSSSSSSSSRAKRKNMNQSEEKESVNEKSKIQRMRTKRRMKNHINDNNNCIDDFKLKNINKHNYNNFVAGDWIGHAHLPLEETLFRKQNKTSMKLLKQWAKHEIICLKDRLRRGDRRRRIVDDGNNDNDDDFRLVPHFSMDYSSSSSSSTSSSSSVSSSSSSSCSSCSAISFKEKQHASSPPLLKAQQPLSQQLPQLHVSLSKSFRLQHFNIDSFIFDLCQQLKNTFHCSQGVDGRTKVMTLQFRVPILNSNNRSKAKILVNEHGTKSYLVLPIFNNDCNNHQSDEDEDDTTIIKPQKLSQIVDNALGKYHGHKRRSITSAAANANGGNGDYTYQSLNPIYHVSIASVPGDIRWAVKDWYDDGNDNNNCSNNDNLNNNNNVNDDNNNNDNTKYELVEFIIDRIHCTFGKAKKFVMKFDGNMIVENE